MAEETSPTQAATGRSKQERIRDNQRRSRARRQEYLADLERRLSDCHLTCREADMQRDTFNQLHRENILLRELLVYAGVSPDLIESYVLQDATATPHDPNSSLRQIKPKVPFIGTIKDTDLAAESTRTHSGAGPRDNTQVNPGLIEQPVSCGAGSCSTRPGSTCVSGDEAVRTTQTTAHTPRVGHKESVIDASRYPTYPLISDSTMTSLQDFDAFQNIIGPSSADIQPINFDWSLGQQSYHDLDNSTLQPSVFGMENLDSELPLSRNPLLCPVTDDLTDPFEIKSDQIGSVRAQLRPAHSDLSKNLYTHADQNENIDRKNLF